jgi:hypothetical protein
VRATSRAGRARRLRTLPLRRLAGYGWCFGRVRRSIHTLAGRQLRFRPVSVRPARFVRRRRTAGGLVRSLPWFSTADRCRYWRAGLTGFHGLGSLFALLTSATPNSARPVLSTGRAGVLTGLNCFAHSLCRIFGSHPPALRRGICPLPTVGKKYAMRLLRCGLVS